MTGNNRAFTLTEMLVTVAITAILTAVSLPSYRRYAGRARQQEAKAALTTIYTMERTFFTTNSTFTLCLRQIGFDPVKEKTAQYYSTGFIPSSDGSAATCGKNGGVACKTYSYNFAGAADSSDADGGMCTLSSAGSCAGADNCFPNNAVADKSLDPSQDDGPNAISVSRFAFTARAAGSVVYGAGKDHWTINEDKSLLNTIPGL